MKIFWGLFLAFFSSIAVAQSAGTATAPAIPAGTSPWVGILFGVSSLFVFAGSKLWDYWSNRRAQSAQAGVGIATDLTATQTIQRQEARISSLEARIEGLEARLNSEQDLRRQYQDNVVTLRMRVAQLEQILRDHDIPVPNLTDLLRAQTPPIGGT